MNLLTLVSSFCRRNQLKVPTAVATSTDDHVLQILEILNELLYDTVDYGNLQAIRAEATVTTLAAELQGALSTLAPSYVKMIPGSMWNRTRKVQVSGPISESDWQNQKSLGVTAGFPRYRIMSNSLYLLPAPAAGETITFEYQKFVVVAANNSLKEYFSVDTDTCLIPDRLLLLGLRWRWLETKGLPSASAGLQFSNALETILARERVPATLNLNGGSVERGLKPSITVPLIIS